MLPVRCVALLFAFSVAVFISLEANAEISAVQCEKIRAIYKKYSYPFFFQNGLGYLPLTKGNEAVFWMAVKNQAPNSKGFSFVYLATPDDKSRATFFLVKQRFAADADAKTVGIFNNIRGHSAYPTFHDFQEYNKNFGPAQKWVQWLHTRPGWIVNRDFIDSTEVPLPRKQFAFERDQNGDDLKAYLLAVRGIRPRGTCLDFAPTVPRVTRNVSISVTDIRKTETGDPREPFIVGVERAK